MRIIKGRRAGSERAKRVIAEGLGYSFEEFMALGRGKDAPQRWTEVQPVIKLVGPMDKAPDELRIVAFVDKSVGYTGMDFLGLDRVNYPESVRIISVPSTAIIGLKHLLYAFAYGADGVLVIEGQQEIDEKSQRNG
jgi:hypothetical protein